MKTKALQLSSLAFALGLSAQAPPGPPVLEDLLPASSFASLRFGGLDAFVAAAQQLPAAGVIERFLTHVPADTRARFVDRWFDDAAQHVRQLLQRQGIAPSDVRELLGCPHVLGIGRPTITGMGPSVALLIETGNHHAAVERLLAALEAIAARQGVAAEVERHSKLDIRTWRIAGGPPIHVFDLGHALAISNSIGYLTDIAAVLGGEQPSLAAGSLLGAARARLAGTVLLSGFANTQRLSAMLDPVLPYEAADWGAALGIGSLDGLYAGTAAGPEGGSEILRLGVRGDAHGLFKVALSKPVDLGAARICSANTVAFGALRLDAAGLIGAVDHFLDLLPAETGSRVRQQLQRELGRGLRRAGTSPEEVHGLINAFGDQVTAALSLEQGALPKPELLVRIEVRDAPRVAALLQRLTAMVADETGLEWKQRKVDENVVHFVNVDVEQRFKLSPCWALADGALLLGSDAAVLVRALRLDDPEDSLAAQEDFRTLATNTQGAFGVLHLRLFRGVDLAWRTVETMVFPQVDAHADDIGFDSSALPDSEAMGALLDTSTVAAFADESGYSLESRGALGSGAWLAAIGVIADEVLARAAKTPPRIY